MRRQYRNCTAYASSRSSCRFDKSSAYSCTATPSLTQPNANGGPHGSPALPSSTSVNVELKPRILTLRHCTLIISGHTSRCHSYDGLQIIATQLRASAFESLRETTSASRRRSKHPQRQGNYSTTLHSIEYRKYARLGCGLPSSRLRPPNPCVQPLTPSRPLLPPPLPPPHLRRRRLDHLHTAARLPSGPPSTPLEILRPIPHLIRAIYLQLPDPALLRPPRMAQRPTRQIAQ